MPQSSYPSTGFLPIVLLLWVPRRWGIQILSYRKPCQWSFSVDKPRVMDKSRAVFTHFWHANKYAKMFKLLCVISKSATSVLPVVESNFCMKIWGNCWLTEHSAARHPHNSQHTLKTPRWQGGGWGAFFAEAYRASLILHTHGSPLF